MSLKIVRFIAVLLAAFTLGMGFCHLMELPARIGWDQHLWVDTTVQGGLYRVFGSLGALIDVAAIVALALNAYFMREQGWPHFRLALAAPVLFAVVRNHRIDAAGSGASPHQRGRPHLGWS
jgi:hypothetical protein